MAAAARTKRAGGPAARAGRESGPAARFSSRLPFFFFLIPGARGRPGKRRGRDRSGSLRRRRLRGESLGGRRLSGQEHGRQTDQRVDGAAAPEGLVRADPLEQVEGGQKGPGHGPERVGSVEQSEEPAAGVLVRLDSARRGRKRASHQDRRHREDESGEKKPRERPAGDSQGERAADGDVRGANEPQERRRQGRRGGDRELEHAVEGQGASGLVRPASQDPTPDSQAAHEDRDDRGGGGGGEPEDQPQIPHPGDLIDERRQTGAKKQERNPQGP